MESESEYRNQIRAVYDRIEKAFEEVDPDIAECEQSQGALTILFADRSRCILSAQPSVRQLWVALASRGTAYHFNHVNLNHVNLNHVDHVVNGGAQGEINREAQGQGNSQQQDVWVDDKGQGIELMSFLEKYFNEVTGLKIQLKSKAS